MAELSPAFRARLAKIPAKATQAARAAMEQGAEEIVTMMRRLAPVDDGELRASINWKWGDAPPGTFSVTTIEGGKRAGQEVAALRITIYANPKDEKGRPYASWVEFGTKNSAPNPFFWPSYRSLRRRVYGRIYRAVKKSIKEA
mgnify:CR=1 FL=1